LYTTPVIYLFFDGLADKMSAWRGKPRRKDAPGDEDQDEKDDDAQPDAAPQPST
jgi:hypothetical protein